VSTSALHARQPALGSPGVQRVGGALPAGGALSAGPTRVLALDALRGLAVVVMLLVNNPGERAATLWPLRHSEWAGLTPADLVFPIFLFAVGACLPFSTRAMTARTAVRRAGLLFLLGCALSSIKLGEPVLTMGVLQHIAGAYLLGWAVTRLPRRFWPLAAAALLAVGWAVYEVVGGPGVVPGSYAEATTPAGVLDTFLLGAPRAEGVVASALSAVSVVGGAVLGAAVRDGLPAALVRRRALLTAAACGGAGLLLALDVPVVKALWTPSYALLGHAAACALLALLLTVPDRPQALLRTVGANPLAVYVLATLAGYTVLDAVRPSAVGFLLHGLPGWAVSLAWALLAAGLGCAVAVVLRRRGLTVRL
jgi:predicted acyltransferase